jgi:hypothetical protein
LRNLREILRHRSGRLRLLLGFLALLLVFLGQLDSRVLLDGLRSVDWCFDNRLYIVLLWCLDDRFGYER